MFHVEHISGFVKLFGTKNTEVFHVEHSAKTFSSGCSTWNISVQRWVIFIRKSLSLQQYVLVITLHRNLSLQMHNGSAYSALVSPILQN
jgi:hypothetical protein